MALFVRSQPRKGAFQMLDFIIEFIFEIFSELIEHLIGKRFKQKS